MKASRRCQRACSTVASRCHCVVMAWATGVVLVAQKTTKFWKDLHRRVCTVGFPLTITAHFVEIFSTSTTVSEPLLAFISQVLLLCKIYRRECLRSHIALLPIFHLRNEANITPQRPCSCMPPWEKDIFSNKKNPPPQPSKTHCNAPFPPLPTKKTFSCYTLHDSRVPPRSFLGALN